MANSSITVESELVSMESGSCGTSSGYGTQKTGRIQPRHGVEKKEQVKQCLREIKSLMPIGSQRQDLLGTLQQVVQRMKEIKDTGQQGKTSVTLAEPPQTNLPAAQLIAPMSNPLNYSDSDYTQQKPYQIVINTTDSIVVQVSEELTDLLDYPTNYWDRHSLMDFMRKSDLASFSSRLVYCRKHSTSGVTDCAKDDKNTVFFKIRHYKSLHEGFNTLKSQRFKAFYGKMSRQRLRLNLEAFPGTAYQSTTALEPAVEQEYIVLQCRPLHSSYPGPCILPEKRTFMAKHTRFCFYSDVEPSVMGLLGYLPQDIVNTSVFNYYHTEDLPLLHNIYQLVLSKPEGSIKSAPFRLKAQNGNYVIVETIWSSTINPWTKQLDSITCLHTVVCGPANINVFDKPNTSVMDTSTDNSGLDKKIKMLLMQMPFPKEVPPPTAPAEQTHEEPLLPKSAGTSPDPLSSAESGLMSTESFVVEAIKMQDEDDTSGSIQLCDSDVSVLYEGLSYASNIRRFLTRGVSPTILSEGIQQSGSGDSPDEDLTVDVELPLPARIPSYASSTKALVSEHEREELPLSPAHEVDPNIEEANRESSSSDEYTPVRLTVATLKAHDKLHERDFIQKVTKERAGYLLSQTGTKMLKVLGLASQKRHQQDEDKIAGNKLMRLDDGQAVPNTQSPTSREQLLTPAFPLTSLDTRMTNTHPGVAVCDRKKDTTTRSHPSTARSASVVSWRFPHIQLGARQTTPASLPHRTNMSSTSSGTSGAPCGHMRPANGLRDHFINTANVPAYWSYYQPSNQSDEGGVRMMQPMFGVAPGSNFCNQHQQHQYINQVYPADEGFIVPPCPMHFSAATGPVHRPRANIGRSQFGHRPMFHRKPPSAVEMDYVSSDSSLLYLLDSSTTLSSNNNISSNSEGEGNHDKDCYRKRLHRQGWKCPLQLNPDPPWKMPVNWNSDLQMSYVMPEDRIKERLDADRRMLHHMRQPAGVSQQLDELLLYLNLESDEEVDDFYVSGYASVNSPDQAMSDFSEQLFIPRAIQRDQENPQSPQRSSEVSVEQEVHNEAAMDLMKEPESHSQTKEVTKLLPGSDESSSELGIDEDREDKKSLDKMSNDFSEVGSESSKIFSDLTPSDNRSNEEALSSLKESDNCSSSSSSGFKQNGNKSPESEGDGKKTGGDQNTDYMLKLFVPLKVKREESKKHWLQDVEFSENTQLQYQQRVVSKEDVLFKDKQMLMQLTQPDLVQMQMNCLKYDVDDGDSSNNCSSSISSLDPLESALNPPQTKIPGLAWEHGESFMSGDMMDDCCKTAGRRDKVFSYDCQSMSSGGKQNILSMDSNESSSSNIVSLSAPDSCGVSSLKSQDKSSSQSSDGVSKESANASCAEQSMEQSSSDPDMTDCILANNPSKSSDLYSPYSIHGQLEAVTSPSQVFQASKDHASNATMMLDSTAVPGAEDLHSVMSLFTLEQVLENNELVQFLLD